MTTHNDLAERIERADGPDRALDVQIALACMPEYAGWFPHPANNGNQYGEIAPSRAAFDEWLFRDGPPCLIAVPVFTGSIDAALALVDDGIFPTIDFVTKRVWLRDKRNYDLNFGPAYGFAKSVAGSICAAALRAQVQP
ncbi:MAG: hypothetical protein ACT6Q7_03030 [Blastomonas fulva]|uniref:hypothetical protein n=1 Tax=Blastomonas fulva TaxID=1550728 RepID=UPI0040347FDC